MPTATHRFALHLNVADQIAHLISITFGESVASHDVAGLWFGRIECMQDFVSHALEVSYGDADGILMALDMQGKDEGWYELDAAGFALIAAIRIPGVNGSPFAGHRFDGDRMLATIGPDTELDLTEMLKLPIL